VRCSAVNDFAIESTWAEWGLLWWGGVNLAPLGDVIGEVGAHEFAHAVTGGTETAYTPFAPTDLMSMSRNPDQTSMLLANNFKPTNGELEALLKSCLFMRQMPYSNSLSGGPPTLDAEIENWLEQLFELWATYVEPPTPPGLQEGGSTSKAIFEGQCIGGSGCGS